MVFAINYLLVRHCCVSCAVTVVIIIRMLMSHADLLCHLIALPLPDITLLPWTLMIVALFSIAQSYFFSFRCRLDVVPYFWVTILALGMLHSPDFEPPMIFASPPSLVRIGSSSPLPSRYLHCFVDCVVVLCWRERIRQAIWAPRVSGSVRAFWLPLGRIPSRWNVLSQWGGCGVGSNALE